MAVFYDQMKCVNGCVTYTYLLITHCDVVTLATTQNVLISKCIDKYR